MILYKYPQTQKLLKQLIQNRPSLKLTSICVKQSETVPDRNMPSKLSLVLKFLLDWYCWMLKSFSSQITMLLWGFIFIPKICVLDVFVFSLFLLSLASLNKTRKPSSAGVHRLSKKFLHVQKTCFFCANILCWRSCSPSALWQYTTTDIPMWTVTSHKFLKFAAPNAYSLFFPGLSPSLSSSWAVGTVYAQEPYSLINGILQWFQESCSHQVLPFLGDSLQSSGWWSSSSVCSCAGSAGFCSISSSLMWSSSSVGEASEVSDSARKNNSDFSWILHRSISVEPGHFLWPLCCANQHWILVDWVWLCESEFSCQIKICSHGWKGEKWQVEPQKT